MTFSVVIPTLGRPDLLRETLESLAACDPVPDEVIVVDGGRDNGAADVVQSAFPGARYLRSEPGLTRQRNTGIDAASGDAILFLDDDVEVDPRLFAVLGRAYADDSVVGATGNVIERAAHRIGGHRHSPLRRFLAGGGPEGTFTPFGYPRYVLDLERPHEMEFMPGCLMSVRRDLAARVRFDESLTGYALAEDEDFSYRLSRLGRIRYLPDAVVEHKKTGFSSQDPRAFGRSIVLNRAYLFRKNFPQTRQARAQFALLLLLMLAHRLANREWAGARGLVEGMAEAWRRKR
jgi:GT2 family glycosyltransferase